MVVADGFVLLHCASGLTYRWRLLTTLPPSRALVTIDLGSPLPRSFAATDTDSPAAFAAAPDDYGEAGGLIVGVGVDAVAPAEGESGFSSETTTPNWYAKLRAASISSSARHSSGAALRFQAYLMTTGSMAYRRQQPAIIEPLLLRFPMKLSDFSVLGKGRQV